MMTTELLQDSAYPAPPLDTDQFGDAEMGEYRLVPGWFGSRLEQLWRRHDGSMEWRKATRPVRIGVT